MNPKSLDNVLATYRAHGHRHYGEYVTEVHHALPCAIFAQQAGERPLIFASTLLQTFIYHTV